MKAAIFALGLVLAVAPDLPAQTTSADPAGSPAYTGTVGDWAIGIWEGTVATVGNGSTAGNTGLVSSKRSMQITKDRTGVPRCFWGTSRDSMAAAKKCQITANAISLVSAVDVSFELSRTGANSIVGTMPHAISSYYRPQIFMTRISTSAALSSAAD